MSETTLPGNRPESSLQVWAQLLDGLRRSGFREAGPEYLRLSTLVAETRHRELLSGPREAEEAAWKRLTEIGAEAHALLAPLAEAARILAELPTRASIKVASSDAATSASPGTDLPVPVKPKKSTKPRTKAKASRKHTKPSH